MSTGNTPHRPSDRLGKPAEESRRRDGTGLWLTLVAALVAGGGCALSSELTS